MNYQLFQIKNWQHNPRRRKHRFRCQQCSKIIEDGLDIVIERRGKSSHGYHVSCFCKQDESRGAIARNPEKAQEILNEFEARGMLGRPRKESYGTRSQ